MTATLTTAAKTIMAPVDQIRFGSANKALAAKLYKDFKTALSLFKFPVLEDEFKILFFQANVRAMTMHDNSSCFV